MYSCLLGGIVLLWCSTSVSPGMLLIRDASRQYAQAMPKCPPVLNYLQSQYFCNFCPSRSTMSLSLCNLTVSCLTTFDCVPSFSSIVQSNVIHISNQTVEDVHVPVHVQLFKCPIVQLSRWKPCWWPTVLSPPSSSPSLPLPLLSLLYFEDR